MNSICKSLALVLVPLLLTACISAPQSAAPSPHSKTLSSSAISMAGSVSLGQNSTSFDFQNPKNWEGENPLALLGGWHAGDGLGALFNTRYLFLADGRYYYAADEYNAAERVRYTDGTWNYEENTIYLTIHRQMVVEGGEVVEANGQGSRNNWITGGTLEKYEMDEGNYTNVELPVRILDEDFKDRPYIRGSIQLNGVAMYAIESVGYDDLTEYWENYRYVST